MGNDGPFRGSGGGKLRGGIATPDGGQPVLADERAGEDPGECVEEDVGYRAAAEVIVDDLTA